MARELTPEERLLRIAARQESVVSTDDLRRVGLTKRQAERRVETGRWVRRSRGVYALGGVAESWRRDAVIALLSQGRHAVFSHLTAAAFYEWAVAPARPHLVVPKTAGARSTLAVVHRSNIPAPDRTRVGRWPVTSPARTLVDCASLLEREELAELVDLAVADGRCPPDAVLASLARSVRAPGRHGTVLLREVLHVWHEQVRPESPAEARLLRQLEAWGIPTPVLQHEVVVEGRLVGRVDVAWPAFSCGLEYDGRRHHGARRYAADEARHQEIVALGWRLDRVSKLDLLPGEDRLRHLLHRWFARAA